VDCTYQRSSTSERYFLQQIHQRPEKASVEIDRKILADIAVFDKVAFTALVEKAKAALA
jgi:large subunit ribosomal protein L20